MGDTSNKFQFSLKITEIALIHIIAISTSKTRETDSEALTHDILRIFPLSLKLTNSILSAFENFQQTWLGNMWQKNMLCHRSLKETLTRYLISIFKTPYFTTWKKWIPFHDHVYFLLSNLVTQLKLTTNTSWKKK